jgi:hypothetical protein
MLIDCPLDSNMPCFAASGEQTAAQLRERFQPTLTHSLVGEHCDRLIDNSLGSHWTRLYDSVCTTARNKHSLSDPDNNLVPILFTIYTISTYISNYQAYWLSDLPKRLVGM